MKLIKKSTGDIIAEIMTNHSMTLEEAICCAGGEIINDMDDDRFDADGENVIIDGNRYFYDDTDIVCA